MFIKAAVQKSSAIVTGALTLALCLGIIVFSKSCAEGAKKGIEMCLSVLVPSLFPFMALASFIVKSGLSKTFGKPFGKIMRVLFGLDSSFAPVVLMSMIGGYPVGAKGISALVESKTVSIKQAKKAAMFLVCAGPGFLINFVGVSLYDSKVIGAIILSAQIISMLVLGILINLFDRNKEDDISDKELTFKAPPLCNSIVEAASDSSKGILNICVFVVLFSAFTGMIDEIISDGAFKSCIMCLLEVCSAVDLLSANNSVEFVAFAIGFGGLCVHFQIYSALGNLKINKLSFFLLRIIQGAMTGLLTHFGLKLFVKEAMVFSTSTVQHTELYGGSIISGLVLIAVSLCFLYTLKLNKSN
jgi:sporulation integral membrane protein YlbJ